MCYVGVSQCLTISPALLLSLKFPTIQIAVSCCGISVISDTYLATDVHN